MGISLAVHAARGQGMQAKWRLQGIFKSAGRPRRIA
jgi:hypothetical protein